MERLAHFDLLQKIGEGGMGVVYKARDTRLERVVAIKLLPESRAADADRRARFIHEAKAASALNHPNIVAIHEVGEHDGRTFMVMEFVDGKPLNELIPRKGMRLTEALRVAAQVADALTAAHAAGIVHRDLKPGNIMVDGQGRVKVLDFGLAKLTGPAAKAVPANDETGTVDDETRTVPIDRPLTEEGAIVGSVPYMSPEQAEGRPVDARSDIFSFGAVLYEMITGQRAFRGESRISTLAAVVERDPGPPSEMRAEVPPELDRLIARCLRKDVHRRSQNMSDVKLALEELRDESESGKLSRPWQPAKRTTSWLWPAVAAVCVVIAAALAWALLRNHGAAQLHGPELVRVSPDDGHTYLMPSISPDGKFVAYVSDRSGQDQLWLQQIGGGDPIQLTHSTRKVDEPQFFPDGTRIVYSTDERPSGRTSIEVVHTLGGQPQILVEGKWMFGARVSPDGLQIAYTERQQSAIHQMLISSSGGQARELTNWKQAQYLLMDLDLAVCAWTPDSRFLLCLGSQSQNSEQWDWFALPINGGDPIATGAGTVLRAAGLKPTNPDVVCGLSVLFQGTIGQRSNAWEISLSPGAWHVAGTPRQLTFGTEDAAVSNVSTGGMGAVEVAKYSTDLFLVLLDSKSGQATGVLRRLTHDSRWKYLGVSSQTGDPTSGYFSVMDDSSRSLQMNGYAINLTSGAQTLAARYDSGVLPLLSPDGRQVAYIVAEDNAYSIRVGDFGGDAKSARTLCRSCGLALRFSPDERFVLYVPGVRPKPGPDFQGKTIRLLEVASGKDRAWLEHPTDSIVVAPGSFGEDGSWVLVQPPPTEQQPSGKPYVIYIVPWREEPVPFREWIEVKGLPARDWRAAPASNLLYLRQGSKYMAVRFDANTRSVGQPFEVKFPLGSEPQFEPTGAWQIRGPGLLFTRPETHGSVWLMRLPE